MIGEEYIKLFEFNQIIFNYIKNNNISNQAICDFINKNNCFNYSFKLVGIKYYKKKDFDFSNYVNLLEKYSFDLNKSFFSTNIIYFNNKTFKLSSVKEKFNDSVVKIVNKKEYGLVKEIFIYNETAFLICQRIILLINSFHDMALEKIKSNFYKCYISNIFFIEEVQNLETVFFCLNKNGLSLITNQNSKHLFT